MKREDKDTQQPQAVVREINGQLVLDDPLALSMFRAVEKHNCKNTLELNSERVKNFKQRVIERGMTAEQVVIILLNVDDTNGGEIAKMLMPGFNWQEIRDKGEVPFTRGLAGREGIQEVLEAFDEEAAAKLREMKQVAVVVVDHGVAEVFEA
ncbi:MAG: hypothetical protein NTZ13_04040 [Candidatus Parcubacteria bacterium]|nr:hypothetical protein [Candidatus Parcubacteria bacterium]